MSPADAGLRFGERRAMPVRFLACLLSRLALFWAASLALFALIMTGSVDFARPAHLAVYLINLGSPLVLAIALLRLFRLYTVWSVAFWIFSLAWFVVALLWRLPELDELPR